MKIDMTGKCEVCEIEFAYVKEKVSKPDLRTCSKKCSYALRNLTRRTVHEPLEKSCLDCKLSFLDTSKKKLVDRCKMCVSTGMVETRRENGSYRRSEAQNEKTSESLRRKYESGWNPNTLEHREKLSREMKNRWSDGSMREKTAASSIERWGVEHWTKSEEGRQFASTLHKGRTHKDSARKNMSIGAARRIRENNSRSERGKGGYREDLGHYVRSNWEANFARILKLQGKQYKYEPLTFTLSSGKTYTPDFLVGETFYEVKGYWTELAKNKFESFLKDYPNVKVKIIEGPEYDEFRSQYRDQILWEGK